MVKQNISIIGLPEAGKTTYIAALWALMITNSTYCSMNLETLKEGNQEYLNKISEDWASFQEVGRTATASVGEVVMKLRNKTTGQLLSLNIPDFHGELFDAHFRDREWSEDYFQLMSESNEFIVFIDPSSPNNIARTIMNEIDDMEQFEDLEINVPEQENDTETSKVDSVVVETKVYQHINTSNQVKLVEILQYLKYNIQYSFPLKLAIIVSKWDIVTKNFQNAVPDNIVKVHLPLLYQFLKCNQDIFYYKFFGISAQGGNYKDNTTFEELVARTPEDRIIVFDGEATSKDIATPITWLTE